jgi:hypothetical protein
MTTAPAHSRPEPCPPDDRTGRLPAGSRPPPESPGDCGPALDCPPDVASHAIAANDFADTPL